jgi:hypothetical protein
VFGSCCHLLPSKRSRKAQPSISSPKGTTSMKKWYDSLKKKIQKERKREKKVQSG